MGRFAKIARSLRSPVLALLICTQAQMASAQTAQLPGVILGPPNEAALRELFGHPDQWAETRRSIGGIIYADHNFQKIGDEDLRTWFSELRTWGLQLELAVGAIKEWSPTGSGTFEKERPFWDRVMRLGGPLVSIAMDEPLADARKLLHQSDQYALVQTIEFVRLVRASYSNILIGDIEPFPYISSMDHRSWITNLNQALAKSGVKGLDFYRVDPNWVTFDDSGSWANVRGIHDFCRTSNIPFSLIYWASWYPRQQRLHAASDETWYLGLMKEGSGYSAGRVRPDQYVIESWVDAPSHALPDGDRLSFTGSALAFIRQFVRYGAR